MRNEDHVARATTPALPGWVRARLTLAQDRPGLRPAVAVTVPGTSAAVAVPLAAWPWVRAVRGALGSRVHEPPALRPDYDPAAEMARDLARHAARGRGG